jgi:hypothetical protein
MLAGPTPLQNEGPRPFFPPVCLQSHWDPTAILRHTLPSAYVPQPLDPRPWTRICMEYTTAGGEEPAPKVSNGVVLPSGGQFYPPGRYSAAIDSESQLRRLDRPLGTCEQSQWEPSPESDMYDARRLIPRDSVPSDPARVMEVSMPKVLLRSGPYHCRADADTYNLFLASDFVFNNATKQQRYKTMGKSDRPAPPSGTLRGNPEATSLVAEAARPDLDFSGRPVYQKGSYEKQTAEERAYMAANAKWAKPERPAAY